MSHRREIAAIVLMLFVFAAGCSQTTRSQRVSEAPGASTPTAVAAPGPAPAVAAPIPGHPPVDTTGIVKSYDPATGVIVFEDGRVMKLTDRSRVLKPVETTTVRPGEHVIVRSVLPVAIQTATSSAGSERGQGMATVASVDEPNQVVRLTDGGAVRVNPQTKMRMGVAGKTVVLADLRPGDELVILLTAEPPAAATTAASTSPSALPRQAMGSATPLDAAEVMVFRELQAP